MDKWKAITIIGCAFAFALMCFAIKGDSPYDAYNRAIFACKTAKDYQTCIVAVNSGYTRMINGQDNNKNKDNK